MGNAFNALQSARIWAKTFVLKSIKSIWDLSSLPIRKLRALIEKINAQHPGMFSKLTLGKNVGYFRKAELAEMIYKYRRKMDDCPRGETVQWSQEVPSSRVCVERVDGRIWTVSLGFNCRKLLDECRKALHEGKLVVLSELRKKPKKTAAAFELKVWGLSEETVKYFVNKDYCQQLRQICTDLGLRFGNVDYVSFSAKVYRGNEYLGVISRRLTKLQKPEFDWIVKKNGDCERLVDSIAKAVPFLARTQAQ